MGSNTVFIAEKPAMGRALAQVLGGSGGGDGYIDTPEGRVTWGFGHLLREATPDEIDPKFAKWNMEDLPILVGRIPVRPDDGGRKQLGVIGTLLKRADRVVIATDADRAGERIAREIIEHHEFRGPVARLLLRSPERSDIRDALEAMRKDPRSAEKTHPWAFEERARAYEDWHIGMNGTRAGSVKLKPAAFAALKKPWSVGGVQTPVLALIVTRDKEIENFKPRDYFTIDADVAVHSGELALAHAPKEKIFDRKTADEIQAAAAAWKGPIEVEEKPDTIHPYKFFGQTSLQRAAGKMFGWAPAKTLEVAQSLYEKGYITYPRGDCEYVGYSSMPNIKRALENIRALPGFKAFDEFLAKNQPVIRDNSRYNDAKAKASAHEAIVPTAKVPEINTLSSDQRALYLVLARNLAMNHMPAGVDDTKTVSFSVKAAGADRRFSMTGRRVREAGWRALDDRADGEDGAKPIPAVKNGEPARVDKATVETKQTEPPKRWTLSDLPSVMANLEEYVEDAPLSDNEKKSLLAALESGTSDELRGLGTPATRASIIATLLERQYIDVVGAGGKALSAADVRAALDADDKKQSKGARGKGVAIAVADDGAGKGKGKKKILFVRATANGRVLIETWQKVFPRLTDPIQRARLEDGLRRIGRAPDAKTAAAEFEKFAERVRKDTAEMVEAARKAERTVVAGDVAAEMRTVTPGQVRYARSIAKFRKIKIDDETLANAAKLSAFIDEHKPKDGEAMASPKQVDLAKRIVEIFGLEDNIKKLGGDPARVLELIEAHPPESWPATDKMKAAVESIAARKNEKLPDNWREDPAFIRKYLDDNPRDPNAAGAPASEKSLDFARRIAETKGVKIDLQKLAASQAETSKFIDAHKDDGARRGRSAGGQGRGR